MTIPEQRENVSSIFSNDSEVSESLGSNLHTIE